MGIERLALGQEVQLTVLRKALDLVASQARMVMKLNPGAGISYVSQIEPANLDLKV